MLISLERKQMCQKGMDEWMNECVFIYCTYHIVSQGGFQ